MVIKFCLFGKDFITSSNKAAQVSDLKARQLAN